MNSAMMVAGGIPLLALSLVLAIRPQWYWQAIIGLNRRLGTPFTPEKDPDWAYARIIGLMMTALGIVLLAAASANLTG